MLFVKGLKFI